MQIIIHKFQVKYVVINPSSVGTDFRCLNHRRQIMTFKADHRGERVKYLK